MSFQNNTNFSHPHVLHHLKLDEDKSFDCDACQESIITTDPFHGCPSCDFHLHTQCLNAPLHINHPSHISHPLTLLPSTPSRPYICDACGVDGKGACYNCLDCDYDIHLRCANLPMTLLINEHQHDLKLFLASPYKDSNLGFQCDICNGLTEIKHWLYYCQECDFGTHVGCAMKFKETSGTDSSRVMTQMERAQQELDCAIVRNKIAAKAREAIFGHHRRRRPGAYFSDSSDDGLI